MILLKKNFFFQRIGSISHCGIFELYKYDERKDDINNLKSYKKLVLSQYKVELSRGQSKGGRQKSNSILIGLTDASG